ncbi:protein kinase [Streptomyces sp. NPDC056309]|uniref:protein kinase domain-containing protein n=1 Tax=unclassified Streptomyces TaxID=2593676 RepID=UPI0035E22E62
MIGETGDGMDRRERGGSDGRELLDDRSLIAGRYRPLRLLGRGGMGVVYEADDTRLDRRVAVKMLTAVEGLGEDNEAWDRFVREARALARIDHPGVVTLYDSLVQTGTGTPCLVMQLLEGMSLANVMSAAGRLPAAAVCAVALGVADALIAAHEAGVLHRDVKPSNVGITWDGRVVLQDFGLARLAGEAAITRTGVRVGTPQFMAPEAISGALPGPAADWYGLGTCMYLMITGEMPFGGVAEVGALVERALGDGVPRLGGRCEAGPAWLTSLVDELCEKDPALRPQDFKAVRNLLEGGAEGGTEALVGLLNRDVRDGAVRAVRDASAHAEELSEYDWEQVDTTPRAQEAGPGPFHPATLSDATRRIVLASMTASGALSRQREAANLVLRGQVQEAAEMLSVVVPVCLSSLGPDHPTTLTSQYWQALCLARLGAGAEALELLSRVNKRVGARTERGERNGRDDD